MRLGAVLTVSLLATVASAHGMRSAYLEVTEIDAGRAVLRLTVSAPSLALVVPAGCQVERYEPRLLTVRCTGGLEGKVLTVDGIGPIVSEVVVHVTFASGRVGSRVLTASTPSWILPHGRAASVLGAYVLMGLVHIVSGADHLLFLAALAIALRSMRAILIAETAFTVSHTLTFTASTLGFIHVSSTAAEACIALSLVLVALDAAAASPSHQPMGSTARAATLAFGFGLVHGLGFAGGLAELGLPDRAIGWALAGFAVGVEAGQVAFLVTCVALLALATRVSRLRHAPITVVYAVGGTGAFLFFQRLAALVSRS